MDNSQTRATKRERPVEVVKGHNLRQGAAEASMENACKADQVAINNSGPDTGAKTASKQHRDERKLHTARSRQWMC